MESKFSLNSLENADTRINGTFSPLTLSIQETVNERPAYIGKPTVPENFGQNPIETIEKSFKNLGDSISDEDFYVQLVSIHEHDHFQRFVGTEIGLLIHCAISIRFFARNNLLKGRKAVGKDAPWETVLEKMPVLVQAANDYNRTDRIVRVLWDGDASMSQRQMCEDFNWLIELLGGPVSKVYTDEPDQPCSPVQGIGMKHVLEASAVLAEELYLGKYQVGYERFLKLLRFSERDYNLYLLLRNTILSHLEVKTSILALYVVRMSLDACECGIIYQNDKPISYFNFHPAYRLMEFVGALGAQSKYLKVEKDASELLYDIYFNLPENARMLYQEACQIAEEYGDCPMFENCRETPRISSFADFAKGMSSKLDGGTAALLMHSSRETIDYYIRSHVEIREKRSMLPERFIFNTPYINSDGSELLDWRFPCVPFTIFGNKTVDSAALGHAIERKGPNVAEEILSIFGLIGLEFRSRAYEFIEMGVPVDEAIEMSISCMKWGLPYLEDYFDNTVRSSVEYLRRMYS